MTEELFGHTFQDGRLRMSVAYGSLHLEREVFHALLTVSEDRRKCHVLTHMSRRNLECANAWCLRVTYLFMASKKRLRPLKALGLSSALALDTRALEPEFVPFPLDFLLGAIGVLCCKITAIDKVERKCKGRSVEKQVQRGRLG